MKYIEQIEQSPEYKKMGKQELAALNRQVRNSGATSRDPRDVRTADVLVVIDTLREQNAVNEARRLGIPVSPSWIPTRIPNSSIIRSRER